MKHIRLENIIKDENTVNNLIHLYKGLHDKENLEKRLFLKTLVWASLNPDIEMRSVDEKITWIKAEEYFNPTERFLLKPFDEYKLNTLFASHNMSKVNYVYNNCTHKYFGFLT